MKVSELQFFLEDFLSFCQLKFLSRKTYVAYLLERGKYTVVSREESKEAG